MNTNDPMHVSNIINLEAKQTHFGSTCEKPSLSQITPVAISRLFGRLALIYPYQFAAQFPENDKSILFAAHQLWLEALKDLTLLDIKRGIEVCMKKKSDYIPNLPTFRDYCLPSMEELGIPDIDDAWAMANSTPSKCPVVWHAVQTIGSYAFRNGLQKDMQLRFATVYSKLVQRARKGEKFVIPSNPQLPNPDSRPFKRADPSVRDREIAKMCNVNQDLKQLYKGK